MYAFDVFPFIAQHKHGRHAVEEWMQELKVRNQRQPSLKPIPVLLASVFAWSRLSGTAETSRIWRDNEEGTGKNGSTKASSHEHTRAHSQQPLWKHWSCPCAKKGPFFYVPSLSCFHRAKAVLITAVMFERSTSIDWEVRRLPVAPKYVHVMYMYYVHSAFMPLEIR